MDGFLGAFVPSVTSKLDGPIKNSGQEPAHSFLVVNEGNLHWICARRASLRNGHLLDAEHLRNLNATRLAGPIQDIGRSRGDDFVGLDWYVQRAVRFSAEMFCGRSGMGGNRLFACLGFRAVVD